MSKDIIYNKGDLVPAGGEYICVPCGYKKSYNVGEIFSECTSCFAGTKAGQKEFADGTGIWEKVIK